MTDTGTRPSFDEYVEEHGRALERYAFVLTGRAADAQDLVQNALIKAYRRWRRVSALDHPDAYVRRILTNCYLDQRRRRSNTERPTATLPDAPRGYAFIDPHSVADPAEGIVSRDAIVIALQTLSPHQRTVVVLRHFLGLDDAAIATELGCGEATVRSHASRGLDRLRAALASEPAPIRRTSS
jgi:RNA polymerase sigma-70 factor (sigma-E family)